MVVTIEDEVEVESASIMTVIPLWLVDAYIANWRTYSYVTGSWTQSCDMHT